jgi:hypothetical protein
MMMRRDDDEGEVEDDEGCSGTAGGSAGPVGVCGVAPGGTLPPLLAVGLRMMRRYDEEGSRKRMMMKGAVRLRAEQRVLFEYAGKCQEDVPSVSGGTADEEG